MGGRITVESQPQIGSTFNLYLPLKLAAAAEPKRATGLTGGRVRILSRRPSLTDSLARHASLLGLEVLADDSDLDDANVVIVDAGSHPNTLNSLLASFGSSRPALVVIATAAEVEARELRVLLPDEQIVLKPVHRIALYEALATALGMQPRAADAQPAPAAHAPLKGHVLLVEDEPVNAAVAEGYLAVLGCTSVWVDSGAEAVTRIAAERFDLILMDLSMPGMDGFATTALIRKQQGAAAGGQDQKRVPIVALTAHDAARYREKCLAADIDDILTKPYTLDDCAHLLRRWLVRPDATPVARAAQAMDAAAERAADPATLASVDANAVAALRQLQAGKHTDLYAKLVELFRSSSTQALAELQTALERDDLTAIAAVAHKLAAAAANVGALAYASYVRELEQRSLAGDRVRVAELCRELHASHLPLLDTLRSQRLRATA
jgi:two-component system sensor histidine kinase BarA